MFVCFVLFRRVLILSYFTIIFLPVCFLIRESKKGNRFGGVGKWGDLEEVREGEP